MVPILSKSFNILGFATADRDPAVEAIVEFQIGSCIDVSNIAANQCLQNFREYFP